MLRAMRPHKLGLHNNEEDKGKLIAKSYHGIILIRNGNMRWP